MCVREVEGQEGAYCTQKADQGPVQESNHTNV